MTFSIATTFKSWIVLQKQPLDFSPTIIEIFWAKAPLSAFILPRAKARGNK